MLLGVVAFLFFVSNFPEDSSDNQQNRKTDRLRNQGFMLK